MPTIDQLEAAVVAADSDVLLVSQGGTARRVTLAQVLAGTQPEIQLTPGLLGRTDQGYGPPVQLGVGGGLRLADGVLWGPAPFSVGSLPAASATGATDLVPVSQSGQDRAVPISTLLSMPGINVSGQIVTAATGNPRRLGDWAGDVLPVEAFGAVGDGTTDDSAALSRAVASGRPVRLGAKTYRVDGQWTAASSTVLLGTPSLTVLQRVQQSSGAWINVTGPSFAAIGITFDAGRVTGDNWSVLVGPTCTQSLFENCTFANAKGPTLGTGLTIQARDGLTGCSSSHTIRNCAFHDNAVHGLWVQAAAGALVEGCSAFRNAQYGICLDFNDPQFQQTLRQCAVIGCRAWGNQRGISIGNYNETNAEPPRWGLANPDATDILVTGNVCSGNTAYGIAVSGDRLQVSGNQITISDPAASASGILVNARRTLVSGNTVCGPGQFGIDAGGCADSQVGANLIQACSIGINAGGGQRNRITTNRLTGNEWGITAYQVETDGHGQNFGMACSDLELDGNVIELNDSSGGIYLVDGPQNVIVRNNDVYGTSAADPSQALWAHSDNITISNNRWNGQSQVVCNPAGVASQIQFPDIVDQVMVTSAASPVTGIMGQHAAMLAGQVSFIRVTAGGSGYSQARVAITGVGVGARASAYLRDGVVIGVAMSAAGTGYDPASTTVTITGDGQGATATAYVGLPVPQGRRLAVQCNTSVVFKRSGSSPLQDNWTGTDIRVPATAEIVWSGAWGGWQAVSFACSTYLLPGGDGSVSLRSAAGDITLRPAGAGQVRFASETEPSGFISLLGRGSPEGVVAAGPGSDYRNLDGGVGTTLWLKQTGTDSSGWAAIA